MAGGKIYLRLPNMIGQHVATKSLKIDGSLQSSCRQVLRLANSPLESREISVHLVFEDMEVSLHLFFVALAFPPELVLSRLDGRCFLKEKYLLYFCPLIYSVMSFIRGLVRKALSISNIIISYLF